MFKTIIIRTFLQKRPSILIKHHLKQISLQNIIRFSSQLRTEIEIPLNIPRKPTDQRLQYTENNHGYKIMQSLPQYRSILYNFSQNVFPDDDIGKNEFESLLNRNWRTSTATEILNAFKQACMYSRNNIITLSDHRFDNLIDGLMDKVQDLTDDELVDILSVIRYYPLPETITSHNFHDLWSALDDICIRRHHKWGNERLLQIADRWYLLGLLRYGDYYGNCIQRLTRRIKHITPAQLVHILFLMNIKRKGYEMFEYEVCLEKCINELSLDELGIVSMSFFKTRTPIKGTFIVKQMIEKLLAETTTVDEITLSAILKITRNSPHLPLVDLLQRLLTKLLPEIDRFSTVACVHMALVGTNAQFLNRESLMTITEKFLNDMSIARLKDLERLTFALTLCNFTPDTTRNIYQEVLKEITKPSRELEILRFPRCLCCCVHYLGLMKVYDYKLIDKVLDMKFIELSYGPNRYNIGREILFIDASIDIECPNYVGNRLDKKARMQLTKWNIDRIPTRNITRRISAGEKLTLDIKETMEIILGGPEYVVMDYLVPHFLRVELIACKNSSGRPVKISDLKPNPFGEIMEAPKDGNTWYTIVPASWNSYVRDTFDPTGILATKMRQLRILGYSPIMIPWHEFTPLSQQQREDYIKKKLDM